jgi:predicted nucleic acid-binding protein
VIAYFDSSSIVKWFFDEPHMDLARTVRDETELAFTSLVSLPEVMSAFNRAWKGGRCSKESMQKVRKGFEEIWPDFQWVKPDEAIVNQAGQLVYKHNLKGLDALHLACALLLKQEGEGIEVFFSCFDQRLNHAAEKQGLIIHQEMS